MTRRTVNRTHRTHRAARRKEPKDIQEARELILLVVPANHRAYIYAHWHDERSDGRRWSSEGYSCSIYDPKGKEIVDVQSPTPTGLVAAVHRALQEHYEQQARATAEASARALVPVRKPFEGEVVPDDEPRSSTPRLAPRQLPRIASGGQR